MALAMGLTIILAVAVERGLRSIFGTGAVSENSELFTWLRTNRAHVHIGVRNVPVYSPNMRMHEGVLTYIW